MRMLRNGFYDGQPLLLLRFQARHRGSIGGNLGVDIPAEFLKFCLITLELRSTVSIDWPLPSHTCATDAFCFSKGLVTQGIAARFLCLHRMEELLVTRAHVLDVRKLLIGQLLCFDGSHLGVLCYRQLNLPLEELEL